MLCSARIVFRWLLLTTSGLAPLVVGCGPRIRPGVANGIVLVASNRERLDEDDPLGRLLGVERGTGLTFGRCTVSLPVVEQRDPRAAGLLLAPGRAHIRIAHADITGDVFETELEADAGPGTREAEQDVLLYVHGYAATPRGAVRDAAQLAHDLAFGGEVVVFTWPTRGLYLSYFVDSINAEWSVPDFVDLLERIHLRSGRQRIHVLGHSMGARIVVRGVKEFLARRCLPSDSGVPVIPPLEDGKWFGQIVLVAPDEDTGVFERSFAPLLARAAERTTIYFSSSDRVLDLAQWIFGYRRLGSSDCPCLEPELLNQVESIDVTQVDRDLLGHFYHLDSPEVLSDLRRTLAGESAPERNRTSPGQLERKSYYLLRARKR